MNDSEMILNILRDQGKVSGLYLARYVTYRFGARIKDLRDQGHNIVTHMRKITRSDGRKVRVADYELVEPVKDPIPGGYYDEENDRI